MHVFSENIIGFIAKTLPRYCRSGVSPRGFRALMPFFAYAQYLNFCFGWNEDGVYAVDIVVIKDEQKKLIDCDSTG